MDFTIVRVGIGQVLGHVLGQQMAPVAGGVDQHIGRGGSHRTIENGFEGLVARLPLLKAQVVAEHHEFLRAVRDGIHDVRQVGQVGLVHFNQPQAAAREFVEAGLDQGRLAGAPRPCQQHIVRRLALHELQGVAENLFLLRVDLAQVIQAHLRNVAHRFHRAMARAAFAVAPGNGLRPVGLRQRLRQDGFDACNQLLCTHQHMFKFLIHFGILRP